MAGAAVKSLFGGALAQTERLVGTAMHVRSLGLGAAFVRGQGSEVNDALVRDAGRCVVECSGKAAPSLQREDRHLALWLACSRSLVGGKRRADYCLPWLGLH